MELTIELGPDHTVGTPLPEWFVDLWNWGITHGMDIKVKIPEARGFPSLCHYILRGEGERNAPKSQ